jgi:DnaA-homolog protein
MQQIALDMGLAPAASLDNFLAGPNAATLDHLRLWANNPLRSPLPTYLWGANASGKTHLLKSVREMLREQGAAVGWLDAASAEPPEFDPAWACVLMDDVHLYSPAQAQAAFNWFINAQTHQRWVLASGALPPADLGLREDLRSRLGWGHVFALHVLSEAERRAVLRREADARGVFLSDEVMDFMLKRFSRDLGSLMQLLGQLDGYALATKRAITIPLVKAMLENL